MAGKKRAQKWVRYASAILVFLHLIIFILQVVFDTSKEYTAKKQRWYAAAYAVRLATFLYTCANSLDACKRKTSPSARERLGFAFFICFGFTIVCAVTYFDPVTTFLLGKKYSTISQIGRLNFVLVVMYCIYLCVFVFAFIIIELLSRPEAGPQQANFDDINAT